jgi:glycosyltransferase involved in cell wall biosynthesis
MISVTIPTRNSERTLRACLESVVVEKADSGIEILVVDGVSTDATTAIASEMGARVITYEGALLGARRRGVQESHGDIVVLLDSDQVLRPGALERAHQQIGDGAGMVVLGERVWSPHTLVERLSDLDKQLLSVDITSQLDPRRGVFLPRVFRRDVLVAGFASIPASIDDTVICHDHAIIYWECYRHDGRVAYVPDAVWHLEPAGVGGLWRKNYRYGWSTRKLLATGLYRDLIREKTRPREIHTPAPAGLRLASLGFLALKAPAYVAGYAFGSRARER